MQELNMINLYMGASAYRRSFDTMDGQNIFRITKFYKDKLADTFISKN